MGFAALRTGFSAVFVILAPGFLALGFLLTGCTDRAGATLSPPAGPGPSGADVSVPVVGVDPAEGVVDEAAGGLVTAPGVFPVAVPESLGLAGPASRPAAVRVILGSESDVAGGDAAGLLQSGDAVSPAAPKVKPRTAFP